ncbi:hypothetical protein FC18_GL002195 [Lacticaseibacillus sharpeae JCM 1186 = DSM 20505]|uniref:Peptidase S24/S26A/S26B/S26C domain-containing protein n=2 Tax=Lacticaseibacillus sharpeae TaxID=1626 RepID=A0A0R1ZVE9_9LACO|nr:hypothetical protein FC18_GL002195 [Lacticaseibacillus sharpeae JCM 1186 = DSM 20505]
MGKYAGDDDLFITNINGESMNRVIPNHSLVIIKHVDSFQDLYDGEIVIFSEDDESYSVKRFYNDKHMQIINFAPDSSDSSYHPINFRYEDMSDVKIIGRVVSALIEF